MIPWLKDLLWNEGRFIGFVRALMFVLGAVLAYLATLPLQGWAKVVLGIAGTVSGAVSVFIRAGERNPTKDEDPEEP